MAVASNDTELRHYLEQAEAISPDHPTVISKFLENSKEIESEKKGKKKTSSGKSKGGGK